MAQYARHVTGQLSEYGPEVGAGEVIFVTGPWQQRSRSQRLVYGLTPQVKVLLTRWGSSPPTCTDGLQVFGISLNSILTEISAWREIHLGNRRLPR